MRIALAADLHFGSVPEGLAEALKEAIESQEPEVIVIAGDLTLRARRSEFALARAWLLSLAVPALVLPGNHDLPYWNLLQRFASPFRRYRLAAGASNLMPVVQLEGGVVLGFNTTRSWQPHLQWQEGVARVRDIEAAEKILSASPPGQFKAIAAHHPFLKIPGVPRAKPIRRASLALQMLAASGVNIVMSGHVHQSFAVESVAAGQPIVAIGAPTALSTRMRGEPNGFWIIAGEKDVIACTLWLRSGMRFEPSVEKLFRRS